MVYVSGDIGNPCPIENYYIQNDGYLTQSYRFVVPLSSTTAVLSHTIVPSQIFISEDEETAKNANEFTFKSLDEFNGPLEKGTVITIKLRNDSGFTLSSFDTRYYGFQGMDSDKVTYTTSYNNEYDLIKITIKEDLYKTESSIGGHNFFLRAGMTYETYDGSIVYYSRRIAMMV